MTGVQTCALPIFLLKFSGAIIEKLGIARIFNGTISHGETVMLCKADGEKIKGRVSKLISISSISITLLFAHFVFLLES